MPLTYAPLRPTADVGPNEIVGGLSAGNHWKGARPDRSVDPRYDATLDSPPFLAFNDLAGEEERFRVELKPNNFDTITRLKLFLIHETDGQQFDPASGFMEFPLKVYAGDNVTEVAATTAHIANNVSCLINSPDEFGPYWIVQEYDLGAVSLDATDVGTGLIISIDSTAPDGWGDGSNRTWKVYAAWLEVEFEEATVVPSIVSGTSRLREVVSGISPIRPCRGDSPIKGAVQGATVIEEG